MFLQKIRLRAKSRNKSNYPANYQATHGLISDSYAMKNINKDTTVSWYNSVNVKN